MSSRPIVVAVAALGMLAAAAPAEAVIRASGELTRISTTRYELVVRNTGDESFDRIGFTTLGHVRMLDANSGDASCASSAVNDVAFVCHSFTLEPGRSRAFGFRTSRAYPTGTPGVLFASRINNPSVSHRSSVTGPFPPAGEPVIGRSEVVEPVRGVVLVRRRGSRRFTRLQRGRLLPNGSEIDTRRGAARVTVASDQPGGLSTATVSEGRAIIDQNRARRPTTTLRLSEPLACPVGFGFVTASRKPRERRIFVKTKGGRFKTRGNHAAGTASGTAWRTSDTCATTTIKVAEGTVRVRDLRRLRTLEVTAPGSYTARR